MSEVERFGAALASRRVDDPAVRPHSGLVPKKPWLLVIGKWFQPRINKIVGRSSKIGDKPVIDPSNFAWIGPLEENWQAIRAEAEAALGDFGHVPPLATISPDHRRIAPAGKWKSFFLYGYGYRIEANCRACPVTASLVAKVPGLNSAFFSILLPRSHIPAHTGVTKAIVTCHLGIRVPHDRERCAMRVVDRVLHWDEGRALVFDDTYDHEVLNDTDEPRVILLIQFRRPARLLGRLIGEAFLRGVKHSRFVQDARRGLRDWTAPR